MYLTRKRIERVIRLFDDADYEISRGNTTIKACRGCKFEIEEGELSGNVELYVTDLKEWLHFTIDELRYFATYGKWDAGGRE
jgi:hypothetical protein